MNTQIKAFSFHLAISVVIAVLVGFIVFTYWHHPPLDTAVGVTRIFITLLIIDVILGPLLTFIIYKPGKKTLLMDLAVIACLQLAALGYGLHTVAKGRPAWLVFAIDRFELVRIIDIDNRKIEQANKLYQAPSFFGPQWVAAVTPSDTNERNEILMESVIAGVDIAQRPNLYQPLSTQNEQIKQRAQALTTLSTFNSEADIKSALSPYPTATAWLPLAANQQDMVVLINKETAEVIAIVDLRPWD